MNVFSFDVFDTLLTRTVMNPKDVFRLMQERLPAVFPDAPQALLKAFWGARVWSEFIARRESPHEDITLQEIYGVLGARYHLSEGDALRCYQLELEVEDALLLPVDGALEMIEDARESGSIVFISDMYLPSDFISKLLEVNGFRKEGEPVYVSGDMRLSKSTGRLFNRVFTDFEITPDQLTHCGDNHHSDGNVPSGLGVRIHPAVSEGLKISGRGIFWHAVELLRARGSMGFI